MAGEKIARLIKSQKTNPSELSDLIFGMVTSLSPLTVKVESGFSIQGNQLILSQLVQEKVISMTIDGKTGYATIFRNLQVGDRVKMLRISKGQRYYVLERG